MLRAIAVATDTSDVVGTVDLLCEDEGLLVHFVRASAYASEYIPSTATRGRRVVIPYDSIREVHDDGETLRLSLAAARLPHRRLVLAHFSRDLREDATRVHLRRRKAQAVVAAISALSAGTLALVSSWLGGVPAAALTTLGAFLAVAAGVWGAQEVGRTMMLGGAESTAERRLFFHELSRHVARARASTLVVDDAAATLGPAAASPAALRGPSPAGSSLTAAPEASPLGELTPVLGAVGAAAFLAIVALAAGRSVVGPDETADARATPTSSAAGVVSAAPPAPAAPAEEPLGLCMCQGPSSPYIPQQLPRLTVLPRVERLRNDPKRPSLALEVAVVNNSSSSLREIKGNVEFLLPGASEGASERVRSERGFYYEGPLLTGRAIKWRLTGRGTSYRILRTHDDMLDDGSLATPDAFFELLNAQTRSVRVHGAMMLARMRDERASSAIEQLREGAPEAEQPMLQSLARAAAPVYPCEVEVTQEDGRASLSACLMNTTESEVGPIDAVAVLSQSEGQPASSPLRRRILIPPKTGVRVQGKIDASEATARVEIHVDPSR